MSVTSLLDRDYPADIIERARKASDEGLFRRRIVKRTARSFFSDDVEYDCGHSAVTAPDTKTDGFCTDCLGVWMDAEKAKPREV